MVTVSRFGHCSPATVRPIQYWTYCAQRYRVSEDWELSLSRERVTIGLYNALLNIRNAKRHGITETCNVGHVIAT